VDFFGDASNYAISLFVLSLAPIWRSRTALWKGYAMALYGVVVLCSALWHMVTGSVPEHMTMGAIGTLALLANVAVALLLYAHRTGDANMRSVWLCSRNDAIGNVAVILAALAVGATGSGWPDIAVAVIMAGLALTAARSVLRHAREELDQLQRQAQQA
jgi:Co/Zn/Cd efflux system component